MSSKKLLTLALALATTIAATVTNASTVNVADNSWHPFDVAPDFATSGGLEWIDINDGSALDFNINLSSDAYLTVVDAGFAGDRFTVFDHGVVLGATSAAVNSYPSSVGVSFDAALANPNYSSARFFLAAGQHDITGLLLQSALDDTAAALNSTVGGLQVQTVPLPASLLLLLSDSGLMGLFSRRRKV